MPGISVSRIPIPFNKGGFSYSSYWATHPAYFALPAAGINVTVGQEVTIYGDALLNVPLASDLTVTYTCDIGTQSGNNLVLNPIAGNIGDHACRIVAVSNGVTRVDETTTIRVRQATTLEAIKVLMIGDSLVTLGVDDIAGGIDDAIAPTVTYLGTQGDAVKHEGRSGFSWQSFVSSGSPFYKSGAVNVPAYFADNSIDIPDVVLIRLGVNDMYGNSANDLTAAEITSILNFAKQLIDPLLLLNSDIKVIIGLPTICENTGAGWNANYDESTYNQNKYIEIMHKFWDALITEFDTPTYNARVSISTEAIFLDRNDGYPKTDGVHTNGVHPDASGYAQLGKALAGFINKEFNYGVEIITNGDFALWTGDNPDDWVVTESGANLITEAAGACRFVSDGTNIQILSERSIVNGASYRFSVNVTDVTTGGVRVKYSSLKTYLIQTEGLKTWIDSTDGTQFLIARYYLATDVTIDNVSVKAVIAP